MNLIKLFFFVYIRSKSVPESDPKKFQWSFDVIGIRLNESEIQFDPADQFIASKNIANKLLKLFVAEIE